MIQSRFQKQHASKHPQKPENGGSGPAMPAVSRDATSNIRKNAGAAPDATATRDPLRRHRQAEADDALVKRTDSAMKANSWLIPGGKYVEAKERLRDDPEGPVLPTMDEHGVEDIVRNLSRPPATNSVFRGRTRGQK